MTTFLLRQLLHTWHPDVIALTGRTQNKLLKTPQLQTPSLIAILAHLPDAPLTAHTPEGKILPCGHKFDVCSILRKSNFFGDLVWGKGRHLLKCPHTDCGAQYTLPMLPSPWVVDGLQARLDLIQWAWAHGKDAPNNADVKTARMLRHILNQTGHLAPTSRRSEITLASGLSQQRLRQTLRLFDTEGVARAIGKLHTGPRFLRGTEPYCRFRPSRAPPTQLKYHPPSLGQYCMCEKPHKARKPRQWLSTPAEDKGEWRSATPRIEDSRKTGKSTQKKTVRFAAPVVTKIQYFEPYLSEPCGTSTDPSTRLDDDREIARIEAKNRL